MTPVPRSPVQQSLHRHLVAGLATVVLLAGGVGGWASTTMLAGAIIAPGVLVVETDLKKVQHPQGGVVRDLLVHDGQVVAAGQVLIRLDDTQAAASLGILTKTLDEMAARQARLEAERDGRDSVTFPADLAGRGSEAEVARLLAGETRLFDLRRQARAGQKAQLRERNAQLGEQIQGLTAQIDAKTREVALNDKELAGVRSLWNQKLIPINRVTAIERDAARLEGERGALIAAAAQARGKVTETELQIIQIDQDLQSETAKELAEIRSKTSETTERKIAAEDTLKRIEIRAPQEGTVHQLAVHTVGGVIGAGEPIMLIVPDRDALIVEAKVPPNEIDRLHLGQRAILRFSALNQRTTPEIDGEVSRVAADITPDPRTGLSFYTIRIKTSAEEIARLGSVNLVPGMPVEAYVQTGERSVVSYLTKPIHDQLARAFKDK